ncbi:MAG: 6-carboxytetrahydropterin synthase [Candidatus Neomarinimicrobiota bacterium]
MLVLTKKFHFCAAHRYHNDKWTDERNREVFGDDHQNHGHNYELEVSFTGEVDPQTGFLADLGAVKRLVQERVVTPLDHSTIQDDIEWFKGRQPSSENLVVYIWERLAAQMPAGVALTRVRLFETPTIYAEYTGEA